MDQNDFILQNLEIDKDKFGRIYSFVDFGNVNSWFRKSEEPFLGRLLKENERFSVDIIKLGGFVDLFSNKKFFYYGVDPHKDGSKHIQRVARKGARFKTVSKFIQRIKHYIEKDEYSDEERKILSEDGRGVYVEIPKCNFDVEMTVDILRHINEYDTLAIFTSDSDFAYLLSYLKQKGKKVILFYYGPTSYVLKKYPNLKINAQRIRDLIVFIKQIPPF